MVLGLAADRDLPAIPPRIASFVNGVYHGFVDVKGYVEEPDPTPWYAIGFVLGWILKLAAAAIVGEAVL